MASPAKNIGGINQALWEALHRGKVKDTQDKALLNARNMAETIIGQIKEFSSLNLSKHRSTINAFVHILAAITAYQINPIKPKLNLQPRYHLETTA